jgi:hypothetical protein
MSLGACGAIAPGTAAQITRANTTPAETRTKKRVIDGEPTRLPL